MIYKSMTAAEVARKVINEDELFILDVRNETDYINWKIEGEWFEILNIPYFDLLDGVEKIIERIPENKDILVVCAKEGSSMMVAEMLAEAGLHVAYLKGA